MAFSGKKATLLLLLGDIAVFALSLVLTLFIRYGGDPPAGIVQAHVAPFLALFCIWLIIFYMAGLYGKRVVLFRSELPAMILRTQLFNIVIAALFFFFVPEFGITPKTNLAVYLIISLLGIYVWRLALFPRLTRPGVREAVAMVGEGPEVAELAREVNSNPRYPLRFVLVASPQELQSDFAGFTDRLAEHNATSIVVDMEHSASRALLPQLYELSFVERRYQFLDLYSVYEEVFDRVPLSLLQYGWFLKHVSASSPGLYAALKRLVDILGALLMGIVTLALVPFIYIAMRLEGPGPLLLKQERFGLRGARMSAYKFRSMRFNYSASATWVKEEEQKKDDNRITRVGAFLRKTSLDEFPQCINILRGELSLVGPRNDIEGLGLRLAEAVPYYNVRYIVKPGLTGWAQINQQYEPGHISPQSVEETKVRLAYDFYYIKHRSLALDIVIALRTVKRMLFRVSSW